MGTTNPERMEIRSDEHIVALRQVVRRLTSELGFSLVDQTKMVTAASEIARNTLVYGGGGVVKLQLLQRPDGRRGLHLQFEDHGPGIPDIDLALRDGYTTGNGLGLGLGGAKRLVNQFELESRPGSGTRVVLIRWR